MLLMACCSDGFRDIAGRKAEDFVGWLSICTEYDGYEVQGQADDSSYG
jgi:hypothetical protein